MMADPENVLRKELDYYKTHRDELLSHYENKFVLIRDNELLGAFDNPQDAYAEAIKRFGNVPVLIKPVLKDERIEQIPALSLGILASV
jgi:hypothetical protein